MDLDFFESLTPEQAREFLDRFLELQSASVDELLGDAAAAGLATDYSLGSLVPLLDWLVPRLQTVRVKDDRRLPHFIRRSHTHKSTLFEFEESSEVDVLRASDYFGESLRRADPERLRWSTGTDPTDITHNMLRRVVGGTGRGLASGEIWQYSRVQGHGKERLMDRHEAEGFTREELEAEGAEALPERALMSTVSLTGADPASDAVDAVTESAVTTATAAAGDPSVTSDPAAQPVEATAVPEATAPVADTTGDAIPEVTDTVGETAPEVTETVSETTPQVTDTVSETVPEVTDTVGEAVPPAGEVDPSQLVDQLGSGSLLDLDVDLDAALDAAAPIDAAVAANANVAAPINAAVSANVLSPGSVSIADADQAALIQQTLIGEASATANQVSTIGQGEAAAGEAPQATGPAQATAPAGDGSAAAPTAGGAAAAPSGDPTVPASGGEATAPAPTGETTAPAPTGEATAPPPAEADSQGLLDLDVDAALDLDVAAPINAAVAANANVAAPINAAVSANVASPDAVSVGAAEQDALVSQTLIGDADAEANQSSAIMQGEEGDEAPSGTA